MALKHGLLGLLNYGQMTGYELNRAFKDSLNFFWQAQTSQIYRELKAMEKLGWLTSEIVVQRDKPNKRLYSITGAGRAELQGWLNKEGNDSKFEIRSAFLMRVFFSGERNIDENLTMLKHYRTKCLDAAAAMENTDLSIERYRSVVSTDRQAFYWGLTANFGKAYVKMCLDWADNAIQTLEESR
ncbi:MAG: PadR family transcriptional regulator [Peptococcaceae bacterium]|nr:PadR family transcriptional regulator [Peptococcaceae bacterium]